MNIPMADLQAEYQNLKAKIDSAISEVLEEGYFINGPQVKEFASNLATFLNVATVVTCGNGTDALQIAMMALGFQPGDEIIIPAFTYVAPAECAALLGLKPVFVDVEKQSFNIDLAKIEEAISDKTKAIVPVHLFGRAVDMDAVLKVAKEYNLFVIEDVAQALGTKSNVNDQFAGTVGDIGCASFFPSKNLGCYGDGGAVYSNNKELMKKVHQIANHGQSGEKFYHDRVGVNSRLDTIQAAILKVKLNYLEQALRKRKEFAQHYHQSLADIDEILLPKANQGTDHTYHQYVIQLENGAERDNLRSHLKSAGISSGIYYPYAIPDLPPYQYEKAFPVATELTKVSLALPIHPYLSADEQNYIIEHIQKYFRG